MDAAMLLQSRACHPNIRVLNGGGSKLHVVTESLHVFLVEVFVQTQVIETLQRSAHTAIVDDSLSLVVIDVRMALELIESQTINGNLGGRPSDNKIRQSLLRKIFYLKNWSIQ